jgi:type I restriction enzyme M protein
MDLRQLWIPYAKKFIQFSDEERERIVNTYHTWQSTKFETEYKDVPEFCYSANIDEIRQKDYPLSPSNYIELLDDWNDVNYDDKMKELQKDIKELIIELDKSKDDLVLLFKTLWYDL